MVSFGEQQQEKTSRGRRGVSDLHPRPTCFTAFCNNRQTDRQTNRQTNKQTHKTERSFLVAEVAVEARVSGKVAAHGLRSLGGSFIHLGPEEEEGDEKEEGEETRSGAKRRRQDSPSESEKRARLSMNNSKSEKEIEQSEFTNHEEEVGAPVCAHLPPRGARPGPTV